MFSRVMQKRPRPLRVLIVDDDDLQLRALRRAGRVHRQLELLFASSAVEAFKMIEAENPANPYSDQEIADLLLADGVAIARRTVAKYRDELQILPARLRHG